MGLFGNREKEEKQLPELPKLPELPRLPGQEFPNAPTVSYGQREFPTLPKFDRESKDIHELPSFPTSKLGEKFSQSTIKNAVTGEEEVEEPEEEADEFEEFQMMPEPLGESKIERRVIPMTKEWEMPMIEQKRVRTDEPIFIRIDKFEESLKVFEKVKEKISEIEHLLRETKELKEQEQLELSNWEQEIQKLKLQIEKVDEDIFSKIE